MHRWFVAVWAACAMACVEPGANACEDDGTLCPLATTCKHYTWSDGDVHLCVPDPQIAACDLHADGESCGVGLKCYSGACLVDGCGNHIKEEASEACDDGNQTSSDGCSATCVSTETCGNGIVDSATRETCDDANFLAHDGCDAQCTAEALTWSEMIHTPHRGRVALAYDSARGRVVVFGGFDYTVGQYSNETLEWDGQHWQVVAASGPSPRDGAVMAYDATHHVTVLFGADDMNDTWLWDGVRWTAAHPATSPPVFDRSGLAYDAVDGYVVLQGRVLGTQRYETWTWDGAMWTQLLAPSPDLPLQLAFDPRRGVVVGVGFAAADGSQIWRFTGGEWTQEDALGGFVEDDAIAWDAVSQRIVIHSVGWFTWDGMTRGSFPSLATGTTVRLVGVPRARQLLALAGTAHVYDGTWRDLAVERPASWTNPSAVTDARTRRTFATGGYYNFANTSDAAWVFDGTWRELPAMPIGRETHVAAVDARGNLVVFGGIDANAIIARTMVFDGVSWSEPAIPQPSARTQGAMQLHAASGMAVYFGGRDAARILDETWLWNGDAWSRADVPGPSPRANPGMTYDAARGRIVLFGGYDAAMQTLEDTWEWDGHAWTQVVTAHAPTRASSIAYDPTQRRVVALSRSIPWTYDGVDWRVVAIADPGPQLLGYTLASDPEGAGVIAVGDFNTLDHASLRRLRYEGGVTETCHLPAADTDEDGSIGCADEDCWATCHPTCGPGVACDPAAPQCGDGVCTDTAESCFTCPGDCACPVACGDAVCDATESPDSCPGDCR